MKNIKNASIMILLLLSSHIKAQNSYQTYVYEFEKVSYSIQCLDKIYNSSDTIVFPIVVTNNSKHDVYVFDTSPNYSTIKNKNSIIRLGSAWSYNPGYEIGGIIKIEKGGTYKFNFFLLLKPDTVLTEKESFSSFDAYIYNGVDQIFNINFKGAFFINKDNIKFKEDKIQKNICAYFYSDSDGFIFEDKLYRFTIGTFEIRLKN